MTKYFSLLVTSFLLVSCLEEENLSPEQQEYELLTKDELEELGTWPVPALEKASTCEWSDDPGGGQYGSLACGDGESCGALRTSNTGQIALVCKAPSGLITRVGGWRMR